MKSDPALPGALGLVLGSPGNRAECVRLLSPFAYQSYSVRVEQFPAWKVLRPAVRLYGLGGLLFVNL